MKLQWQIC